MQTLKRRLTRRRLWAGTLLVWPRSRGRKVDSMTGTWAIRLATACPGVGSTSLYQLYSKVQNLWTSRAFVRARRTFRTAAQPIIPAVRPLRRFPLVLRRRNLPEHLRGSFPAIGRVRHRSLRERSNTIGSEVGIRLRQTGIFRKKVTMPLSLAPVMATNILKVVLRILGNVPVIPTLLVWNLWTATVMLMFLGNRHKGTVSLFHLPRILA